MRMDDKVLKKIYYDPKHPASFSSLDKLYKATHGNISRDRIRHWLQKQDAYTTHAPIVRRNVHVTRIRASGPLQLWESDLFTVEPKLVSNNDQYRFILVVVDVFSKMAWVEPLKNKKPQTVLKGFEEIFKQAGDIPKSLRTDKGSEFIARQCLEFWKSKGILHYVALPPMKAAIAERFIRTLGEKIEKFLTASISNKNGRYIDNLPHFLHAYNHSVHSAHGMKPVEVTHNNLDIVTQRLYNGHGRYKAKTESVNVRPNRRKNAIKEGDYVRLSRDKKTFEKGRKANYTREIFRVTRHDDVDNMYHLTDSAGTEAIKGRVYGKELQRVSELPEFYELEIIQRKGNRVLVHWIGYPSSMDQWLNARDLQAVEKLDPALTAT